MDVSVAIIFRSLAAGQVPGGAAALAFAGLFLRSPFIPGSRSVAGGARNLGGESSTV